MMVGQGGAWIPHQVLPSTGTQTNQKLDNDQGLASVKILKFISLYDQLTSAAVYITILLIKFAQRKKKGTLTSLNNSRIKFGLKKQKHSVVIPIMTSKLLSSQTLYNLHNKTISWGREQKRRYFGLNFAFVNLHHFWSQIYLWNSNPVLPFRKKDQKFKMDQKIHF